jgi:hypothetical protein
MISNNKLSSRDRVLMTINHMEPDRVPIDLGSTLVTGIMAHAMYNLREYLDLPKRKVKVYEIFQMLGEVEMDVIKRFDIDLLPVEPLVQFFGIKRKSYKPWKLWDETEVLMPGQFDVEVDAQGNWLLHEEGNKNKPIEGKMPKGGYYFDKLSVTEYEDKFVPPSLEEIKKENHLSNEELEYISERAEKLRKTTDKALVLDQWSKVGIDPVGSIPNFLELLYLDRKYISDLYKIRTDTAIKNLIKLKSYLKNNIDIICLTGNDYGGQQRELFSPKIFEELHLPNLKTQNEWIHKNTNWKTFQHTCGSIINLIPLLIETGLDILNPVQISAANMDPKNLKERFGRKITFWGGGIDTQKTLAFGTVDDVIAEVKRNIKILAPGGGFVFNTVHNIQQGTSPKKIVAAFDTARKFGKYPIKGG